MIVELVVLPLIVALLLPIAFSLKKITVQNDKIIELLEELKSVNSYLSKNPKLRADEKKQSDHPFHDPIAFLYESIGMCFLIVR
ncbi:hypothetical protein ABER61_16290 [Brevibacillus formosus]|uniref:Uncharacterized protein n=1 Tax=Brevibacillus formosus TaxID=54913 RepID=A0A837KM36_9BACL|nr:hypothetical protein [Brevibacillus formosus]KLH98737.1 hypothetical protein AA984_09290 [Brevibacillus formosus]MED1958020.1 hypothetical protein [Brevibacillus formosus]PSJ92761.1 hypothetical protein C7R91_22675 [Brevibacillus formosus]GED61381.1 hypothetical protein BFO01nite_55130 [Brevibacillus formosus]